MHVIGKYVVELKTNGSNGLSLQKELQDTIEQKLCPKMELLFDSLSTADVSIIIDRMDIKIDLVKKDNWLENMTDEILEQVQTKILSQINQSKQTPMEYRNEEISLLNERGFFKSKPRRTIEKFLFFLLHGYLPWWCAGEENNLNEKSVIELVERLQNSSGDLHALASSVRAVLSNEKAVERLLHQFSDKLFNALLTFLFPMECPSIIQTVDEYELLQQQKTLPELYKRKAMDEFRKELLLTALSRYSDLNWRNFIGEYKLRQGDINNIEAPRLEDDQLHNETLYPEYLPEEVRDRSKQVDEATREHDPWNLFIDQKNGATEAVFIDNAGLVIVSPFLPSLFDRLGWIKDMQLVSPTSAINLLHYLASGKTESREYECVLNKILCGVEVNEPLSWVENISSMELEEADKVLLAIIEHWSVLKNTSMEGLRESFLRRNGKLTRRKEDWLLQVEQKSYDMLLETLPWSISLIRLPFMKASLYVEWM
jgi:hypothetical protein